jgi:hypothetical protein
VTALAILLGTVAATAAGCLWLMHTMFRWAEQGEDR